ncbi:A-kinase anchor protein 9 isoform X4 [Misgurnus anguillicaudatus]|uniref:A-kinase anchor protein 9 isoform X4 n=1 Tax=Misgurnus anguillicaudatus TaxID=75329 RepID=UPI003CCF80DD
MMEDDERQKKLQAGKAKLAEYRQRKAQSDGQKKQKKKKKKAESDVEEQRRDDGDQTVGDQTTVFSLSKTLHSGETVTHDQTYTIEPESEVSTTAEDCSSEVNGFLERTGMTSVMADEESHVETDLQSGGPHSPTQIMQDELAAKTLAMEELSRELEEIRAAFGVEGVQQLQDFEEALKQRDEIITQLTANLQQARAEKEEVMREFLELTEQSQKLQIQFQQLQAGEILRSSNISSTTADLLQARQQISLYQQQLEEKDTKVKGHQEKTEEHLLLITHLQERLAEAERVRTQTEESFAQRLRDKELLNVEQQRLISEHLQTLSQVQDQLLTSTQQLEEVNKHLVAKSQELENCERELSVSREKERMSSGEILQLMKTVEDLQQRCHQGSQSEGEIKQRMEEDWTRRMDQLRAELDEMYGEQIVQMKQELRVQHASDLDRIQERHSADTEKIFLQHHSELERFKGQLSHSTGDVGVLNTTVIELQQKLQESQELCDKAERELKWRSAENIDLVNQVERLHQELQSARVEVELRSKSPEKIQTEMQMLRDAITDLQAQLAAAQKATGDLEAKHESEVTNYKIKLDMLEREKDAVLDRMAESQEAELERLRTQLLFSHEEELVQLRNDLQRESLLNGENLRDEMAVRHREAVELLRMDFEDKARSVENERAVLAAERDALRHEVMALKNDLNQALENLKQKDKMKEENWEKERKDMESENKTLKETNTAMRDELTNLKADREILEEKTERLSLENQQTRALLKDLQDEIEKQRNTFSFAEKNFEVNYQELKDEYTCLVNTKVQLEERLIKQMMHYETKLRDLHVELQTGTLRDKTEDEEVDGKTLVEKDSTELMEKLETSEREKTMLALRLSETVAQLTLMEADVKRLEEELKRDRDETVVRHKERQVQPIEDRSVSSGLCSVETHHMHISSLREETETLKSSLPSAEQERRVLTQEKSALVERLASYGGVNRDPSSHPAAQRSEGGERESTTADSLYVRTHAATHEDLLTDGKRRHPQQVKTEDPQDDGDSIRSQCLMATQDMGDSDHDECRLHFEAQRISLSQIHAAQLELLRESLLAQLRSREQELQDAHERELRCLREEFMSVPQGVRGQSAELKVEFEDLEERHRQEIERLKIYYHEQMKDTEERCSVEVLLLKRRLQERTGAEEIFSTSSICPPLTSVKHEHPQDQESLSVDVEVELASAGLSHELQALQKAQRESSCEGLERNVQEHQMSSHPEDTDLRHLQEKHHRELLEEEIAKVIVQMSVEFAQHTEHTRLSKRSREMSTSTQTQNTETEQRLTDEQSDAVSMATAQSCTQSSDEEQTITQHRPEDDEDEHRDTPPELPDDDDDEEEQQRGVVLAEDFSSELIQQEEEHTRVLESIRASHTHQMEFLQEHNTQLTAQIHTLNQQLLQQREQELLKERERQRDDQTYPSMQSSSTQTEQRREEEEEETKSDGRERPLTSHQPAQDSTSDIITTERDLLRKANSRLRLVLIDVLKTTAAAEETIGRHVEGILQSSCKGQLKATCPAEDPYSVPLRDAFSESFHGSETGADDVSMFSGEIDEGLEMSQRSQGVELQLHEAELQLEREEYLMSISTRLQSAVEKLLNTITETTTELEHAHITKTELMREKFRHNEEMEELIHRQEELQERLRQEARGREQLALELHKAEGLIDGYTGERLALEQQVRERAELQRHLEQELRVTGNRLRELEQERCQMQQERELLSRQQDAMRDGAGSRELRLVDAALEAAPEADLLEETEKLMAEKVEVQLQAQKESSELLLQVKQLEAELEEQVSRVQELEEARRSEGADLRQQIQALEKQLENNRKFMDAADREHERDVFQQEIQTLEQQLKNPLKTQAANEHRDREVQELKSALQEKSDWCSELLLKSEQLQRDVQERNEEIETLGARLRELELMHRVEEVQHVSMAVRASDITLEAQLQTERDALDRKEKEILNLEEQLEQFREELQNKSEEVNQLHMQLEIQRKEISSNQQDLQAQSRLKQVLEEKDGQIAVLNTQITKLQHTGTEPKKEVVKEKDEVVRDLEAQVEHLKNEQEHLRRNKEEEVDQLNAVIEKLQQELSHIEHKQPVEEETSVEKDEYDEMKQKIDEVTKELDTLKSDHHSLLNKYEGLQQEVLTGRHTETVGKLEEALAENKDGVLCELKAQVDHLQSEQERLRRNKEEEVDQLNAVIKKLQQELSHTVHKQPQEEETSVEKAEYDEMKQKTDKVPKELDTLKSDHHSLQNKYEGQQQEVLTGRHTETGGELKNALGENKNEVLHKLEAQVEHLKSEQELLRRNKEEEVNQLNAVIKKLQQELSHFENKQPQEEEKSVEKAKYDEMKQKMDKVPKELDGLKSDHHSLRNKFEGQQQEVLTGRHAETGGELKDALGENKNEVLHKLEAQVEHLKSEQELLRRNKEEEVNQLNAVIKKLQQELSQIEHKQPQGEETSVEKAEHDKMKQKIDEVTRELDTLKSDHHSLLNKYKGLQQEVLTGRHTETVAVLEEALGEEKDEVLCKLEAQVEHLPSEQESLWKNKEEEVDQLKAVIKKLQQELSHIKHKQPQEEETSVEKAEYDKMKQKINEVTKELDTLKSDHHSLLNKYEGLQQEVLTGRHTETGGKLEEALGENKDEVLCKLEAQVEHLPSEQESLRKNKEEEVDQLNAVIEKLQQELSHIKHKQPQEGETSVEKAEYDEMKQKINEVTKELDTLKSDHHSLLNKYEGLQQEMLSGRHTETVTELKESLGEEKDEVLRKMEAQVEHLQNEQEHLRRNKEEEINQLNAVIKKLQQELSHIEHKQPQGEETLVEKAEYDEMKQKTDMVPKELDMLKSDHHSLRNKFEGQQQEVLTGRHTETVAVLKESQGEEKDEVLRKLEAQVEHLQSEQESLRRNKEEEVNQLNAVIKKLQQELSHFDHKQPQEEGTSVEKAEHDKMKQKIDEVTRELDTLKSDHHSLLNKYEGLQQDMLTGRHTETVGKLEEALGENKDEVLHKLEAHVEHLKSEQESLKRNKEEEVDQLNAVIKKLQQELSSIQHKQPQEETSVEKAKYDEMKQKFDEVTKELDTLKSDHHSLLNKYEGQQQEVLTGRHTETVAELEEALREKTAAFVVVQAQVQALEESASSKIMDLSQRVKELEMCVEEKDSELRACRIKVEEAQIDADALLSKVTQLEEKLREKVAAVLVSQAQLGAVQTQSKELHDEAHPKDVTSELSGTTAQLKSKDSGVHLESEGSTVQQPKIPSVNLESKGSTLQLDSQSPTVQQQSKESGVHIESKGPTVQLDSQSPNVQQQSKESGVHLDSKGSTVQLDSQSPTVQQQSKESVVHIESKGPTVQLDSQSPNVQQQSKESGVHLESEGPNIQPESEGARSQVVAPTLTPAGKLSILREKLKELEEGLSGMQKDQELQKYLLCSSEEEVQEYKKRLAVLMDLLNQMRTRPTQHRPESSDEVSDGSQSVSRELQEVEGEAASTKEELNCYRELSHKLQEEIEIKESTIAQLQTALNQVSAGVTREGDVAEAEKLLQELQDVKAQLVITQQELDTYREQSVRLQELVQEREMNVALLKDQLHKHASQEGDQSTSDLLQELQEVKDEAASAKEELNSYRERSLKLQEQIEVRDVSIAQLKEEVQELQAAVTRASDEPLSHPKKKHGDNRKHHGDDKTAPLSQENSTDQSKRSTPSASPSGTPGPSRVDAGTQADLPGADDVAEMIEGYTEKIGQMQELHAAEIMDMEARHISESESLKREKQRLEDRCRTLRDALEKLPTSEGLSVRSERPSVSPFKDEYTSDSSSDWSQRTGYDIIQQELRTTPDGARRDVDPDVLPDRIKTLLREVHQEGMEVLSLSEMERSGEQLHPQTWSLERDALINTIESLKVLISKLHTDTQVDGDWRAELLSAVQQVFVQERDVLRNFHHSHLDTTDAVVHLNQLERILTEQDVRHREFLGVLCSADRKSLITEIQQLRAQINTQHHTVVNSDITGNTERSQTLESEDLQTQLNQTKLQLENSMKSQNKLLKDLDTLRSEVSVKTAELESLNDRLADEQKRVRELQWLHEKDKCKADRKQEVEREEVEDLKLMLEEQRARVVELERERQISGQQTDGQQVCDVSVSAELQVQLEALRCRVVELSSALEKEKHLNTQLIQQLKTSVTPAAGSHDTLMQAEDTCSQVEAGVLSMESLLQTLQSQLAEKQTQTVQLMEQLERQKLNELQRRREFEEEKTSLSRSATQDQSTLRAAREGTARLERQTDELRAQLDAERDDRRMLERERDRLQERVRQLEEKLRVVENNQSTQTDAQSADRTRDWVLQQKTGETQRETTDTPAGQSSDPNHVSNILGRLQLIAAKINSLTSDASGRLSVEASDRDSLAWLHNNVQDVMSLLQHIPSAPSALPESAGLQVGGSSSLLNERLLRQNAELTGFVSRLTEEKNELRNQILRLEEELHRLRQKNFSTLTVSLRSGAERHESLLFSNERESWTQEKSRLEKSLRQAESELSRLRGDIRSDTLRDLTGSDVDNSALRKLYGRYLRAESFRKALIYQKKYLLLLLGGFQECEEATLSLIARMGGRPTHTGLESLGRPRRGFTRFRSAVRVCIALSRMKFLVKRWQRSAGVAFTSQIISRNGQITGTDVRNESSYLHPGGVDVFRERRTPSRGRTGRESPRSAASVQHRYHIIAGDSGGLPCSHLQNYDPDRALTDYISRLEALQRRLGSVQSGSSSYAQMHFGVRR